MRGTLAAVTSPSTLTLLDYDVPDPGAGEVLLRVRRANVCGSDLHAYHWESPLLRGAVLGHEFVGEVVALGDGVTQDFAGSPVSVGDRVVPVYYLTCRRCASCQRGDFNMCLNSMASWGTPHDAAPYFKGGFGTHYMIRQDQYFYRVPDQLSDAVAAGANCGIAQVLFVLDRVALRPGETLAVQGAGGLGVFATAAAKSMGAQVVVIDAVPGRLELATRFGADHVINLREVTTVEDRTAAVAAVTGGAGADVVLEVTGVPAAFPEALSLVRIGGRVVSLGNLNVGPANEVPVAPGLLARKQAVIHGILRYDPWYLRRALEFLVETVDSVPYDALTSAEFPLADISIAFAKSESREVARASIIP